MLDLSCLASVARSLGHPLKAGAAALERVDARDDVVRGSVSSTLEPAEGARDEVLGAPLDVAAVTDDEPVEVPGEKVVDRRREPVAIANGEGAEETRDLGRPGADPVELQDEVGQPAPAALGVHEQIGDYEAPRWTVQEHQLVEKRHAADAEGFDVTPRGVVFHGATPRDVLALVLQPRRTAQLSVGIGRGEVSDVEVVVAVGGEDPSHGADVFEFGLQVALERHR